MSESVKKKRSKKKLFIWFLKAGFLLLFLLINGIGLFAGEMIYQQIHHLRLQTDSGRNEKNIVRLQKFLDQLPEGQWENVNILSAFGYSLQGTYIANPLASRKTVIFLHGFGENRAAGISYLDFYLKDGFNVLLVDARSHGESGGQVVTWGNFEKYALDRWIDWVYKKYPNGEVGVHGVSMGAATALLHSGINEKDKRVSFYIADSSFSDFETLMAMKANEYLPQLTKIPLRYVFFYADIVAYWHDRFTFYQASPVHAVSSATTPILYLHGGDDRLVPPQMANELYRATKGPKELHIFPDTAHVGAAFGDKKTYYAILKEFITSAEMKSM